MERSYDEWRRMLGEKDAQLTIERDKVGDLDSPKHGKIDPNNDPHIGGNQWAGGVGGRDTAGTCIEMFKVVNKCNSTKAIFHH